MTVRGHARTDAAHGRPLRVATLDAQAGRLERATRRILLAAGAEVVAALTAGDAASFGERAQLLRDARPDLVLVPLDDRAGADRLPSLTEPLRFGCSAQRPPPRILLATGDDGAVARATTLLAPFEVEVVPDVRADDGRRWLVARLRELRRAELVLRDEALEELARRVAAVRGRAALVVDVTGSSTSLVRAEGSSPPIAVHARPLGLGRGADHVVARAGLDRVRRWIPWPVDAPTLLDRVFDRARWPGAEAIDREARALEIALAHEAIGHALADAGEAGMGPALRDAGIIVLTGRLGTLPDARSSVLVAIDAIEPTDPASIARDDHDALVVLAATALASGDRSALDTAIAQRLVPVAGVVPVATPRRTLVRIASPAGAREERVDRHGLFVLHLEGELEVSGAGVTSASVRAGPLGLVVDARPRPVALPPRDADRVPAVARWFEAMGVALT